MKSKHNDLESRLDRVERMIHNLENPPKYKYGDICIACETHDPYESVRSAIEGNSGCNIIKNVKILGIVPYDQKPEHCGTDRMYFIDDNICLRKEYECNLITEIEYKQFKENGKTKT